MLYDALVKVSYSGKNSGGTDMYRILLVDDEWLELDTLKNYIPWTDMGFQVAGTAENGKAALRLLEELDLQLGDGTDGRHLPDVVLTDVKMPVMDGLVFSRTVHERYPDMQIVFLSGYNDFEYVRSALSVEACGYILKPLDLEELKKTMEKVREKCSRTFQEKASRALVTAENLKNCIGFSMGEKEALWEDICRSCNAILHCSPENRTFYTGMLSIDEYRFLSGYESNGKDILNAIHMAIRRLTNKRILPLHINDSSYLFYPSRILKMRRRNLWNKKGKRQGGLPYACMKTGSPWNICPFYAEKWTDTAGGTLSCMDPVILSSAAGRRRTLIFRQKENRRIMKCCFPSSRMEKRKR